MQDKHGNTLTVGDEVLLCGTVENISGETLTFRPVKGTPFYVTGDQVEKLVKEETEVPSDAVIETKEVIVEPGTPPVVETPPPAEPPPSSPTEPV